MKAKEDNIQSKPIKRRRKLKANDIQLYGLCIIPMLSVLIFNYLPMVGVILSFKDFQYDKGIFGSPWVGLDNFEYFVRSDDFLRITQNTLVLNCIFIAIGMISALALAILLFEVTNRTNVKIYQTVLITPRFLSWVVVGYMAYAVLHPSYGWLNKIIEVLGGEAVDWYSKPGAWPVILTIFSVWKHIGMDSVVYYASLMGIDESLFEAAEIDGANKWQQIKNITLPSLLPLVTILGILKVGEIFRADFGLFYQLTRDVGTLQATTDVLDTYIFRTMRSIGDMSLSTAIGLLQSFVGMILVITTNASVKKIDPERSLF